MRWLKDNLSRRFSWNQNLVGGAPYFELEKFKQIFDCPALQTGRCAYGGEINFSGRLSLFSGLEGRLLFGTGGPLFLEVPTVPIFRQVVRIYVPPVWIVYGPVHFYQVVKTSHAYPSVRRFFLGGLLR